MFFLRPLFLNLRKFNKLLSVPSFLVQRFLTNDYSSPYNLRNAIYRIINIWNTRLNKFVAMNCDDTFSLDISDQLETLGFVLNISDISPVKASILLEDLSTMRQKSIKSATGELQKIVYSQDDLASNYDFLSLASNKHVVEVATQYFGVPPIIAYLTAWKTFPSQNEVNEMFFHMDHHGHKFLKLFYYLNDVKIGRGHHEYCSSTHKQDRFDRLINERDNKNNHLKNAIHCKRKFGGGLWDADHIIPVKNGGGCCGLDNLRTLCIPCHKNITYKQN